MIGNYLKIAFRNLVRNKVYTFVNVSGLVVGMTATILLTLWIQDELSYDRFHKNAKEIYRVTTYTGKDFWSITPAPIATYSLQELPEVVKATRICPNWMNSFFKYRDKEFTEKKSAIVDPSFFSIFDFPLVQGNAKMPFTDNRSLVITQETAKKYFGNEIAIGKTILVDSKNYTVSGIIQNIPDNSQFKYDFFFPFDILKENYNGKGYWKSLDSDWGNYNYDTYLQFRPNTSPDLLAKKITELHQKNQTEFKSPYYHSLQALENIHLYNADGSESLLKIVRIFIIVAIVILLIACINYINLATARATQRAKEVGVRKAIGAKQSQLFGQFIAESAIVFVIALLFAVLLVFLLMPIYNEISGKHLVFNFFNPKLLFILGITFCITVISAGIYPAIVLSSFKPVQVLKGKINGRGTNISLRKALVVVQFCLSIVLIISTLVIRNQLNFIRNQNLGFDKENVFTFGMKDINKHFEAIQNELKNQAGFIDISAASGNLISNDTRTGDTDWDGKEPNRNFVVSQMSVERNFLKTMNLVLKSGEGFTNSSADSSHFILNETAINLMGIQNPIGKRFKFHGNNGTIVGVVKDFHFQNFHEKIGPMVLFWNPDWLNEMYVKANGKDMAKVIAATEKVWKKYNSAYPFEFHFLNDEYDKLYKSDQKVGSLFNLFAIIAIVISCLGLFGLATFTAEIRTKEIGVRKVLGASVVNIVTMLFKDFVKLVLIAVLLSFPLAWWQMNKFLDNYAYRTNIGVMVFIAAGFLSIAFALITISYQAIKAALMDPVKSIKTE